MAHTIKKRKIKQCEVCRVYDKPSKPVASYRWMRVMDNREYKHRMVIKVDLCDYCATKMMVTILEKIDEQQELWSILNRVSIHRTE